MEIFNVLRLCLLAAATVLLVGFGDVGDAKLAAPRGGASNDLGKQADASRMLLQAQQDEIVGTASYNLTRGARYNALIQITGGLPRNETVQGVYTGTLITAQHVLTHGDCCILDEGGSRESQYIELTLGAYTLPRGMNTTHWVAAGNPAQEIPNAVTRIGVDYYVSPEFVADYERQDLAFCIIRLESPVGDDFMPLPRAPPSVNGLPHGTAARTFGWGLQDDSKEGQLQPITQLKGLDITTTNCGPFNLDVFFFIPALRTWDDGTPIFFCVPATATGSTCHQDYGGPLISEDNLLYGIFINYFPYRYPKSGHYNGMCSAPINKGNIYLNVAAPKIYDLIDEALGHLSH